MTPLPYAPRRKRPLSLWNPLDYLVLLYWVFYFPQALRWYVEAFGSLPWYTDGRTAIREDTVQRRLALQGMVLAIATPLSIAFIVPWIGIDIDFFGLAAGLSTAMVARVMFGEGVRGVATGVATGVAAGVAASVATSVAYGVTGDMVGGVALSVVLGVTFSVAFGVAAGVEFDWGVGVAAGVVLSVVVGVAFSVAVGVAASLWWVAIFPRLDAALLGTFAGWFPPLTPLAIRLQRTSPLPIPRLRRRIKERLEQDWNEGLRECEGLLRYSLQFTQVTAALEEALDSAPRDRLLLRIAFWCNMDLYDWRAVRFQSASLRASLLRSFWLGFLFLSHSRVVPRYDTPARAACAGFWHLYEGAAQEAAAAFEHVRDSPWPGAVRQRQGLRGGARLRVAGADCRLAAARAPRWGAIATGGT